MQWAIAISNGMLRNRTMFLWMFTMRHKLTMWASDCMLVECPPPDLVRLRNLTAKKMNKWINKWLHQICQKSLYLSGKNASGNSKPFYFILFKKEDTFHLMNFWSIQTEISCFCRNSIIEQTKHTHSLENSISCLCRNSIIEQTKHAHPLKISRVNSHFSHWEI